MQGQSRWIALAVLAAGVACGGPTRYVNPNADIGTVKTVAVLPFENLTNDKLCADRVQRIFMTEVLALGAFEVVEPGHVAQLFRQGKFDPSTMTADDFKAAGKQLRAQALFLGSIVEYEESRGSGGAAVTLQLRLVDAESGTTLWSVTRMGRGATVGSRLFGFGSRSSSVVAEQLIREELAAFGR